MTYDKKTLAAARQEQKRDCAVHAEQLAARKRAIYELQPRIREIERELASTAASVLSVALRTDQDPEEAIYRLRDQNLALQQERESLLLGMGFPPDYLADKPLCSSCQDTGYVDNQLCTCMQTRYQRLLQEQLFASLPFPNASFSSFCLDYYSKEFNSQLRKRSPYENMENHLEVSQKYARTFTPESKSLLFSGSTGLGKTFLSVCIAKTVAAQGFFVVYATIGQIIEAYETVKFRLGGASDTPESMIQDATERIEQYENADLLIIDNVGTEMTTTFTVSVLYNLVDERMNHCKPMIINTTLRPKDIGKKYSTALRSRLQGEFLALYFVGDDIRLRINAANQKI